jgi:hypothetical protein
MEALPIAVSARGSRKPEAEGKTKNEKPNSFQMVLVSQV